MLSVATDLIAKLPKSSPIYPYLVGFHALPSIHRLHCHILSSDLDSDKMKKKKEKPRAIVIGEIPDHLIKENPCNNNNRRNSSLLY